MKCPNDDTPLMMTERSGIEIDYCPKCRGVWLDRGELDKIIERAAGDTPSRDARPMNHDAPERRPEAEKPRGDYRHGREFGREHRNDRDDDDRNRHGRRRSSILDDLFDF